MKLDSLYTPGATLEIYRDEDDEWCFVISRPGKEELDAIVSGDKAEPAILSASPIACAVADARAGGFLTLALGSVGPEEFAAVAALDAIELATRESPLRKVRP